MACNSSCPTSRPRGTNSPGGGWTSSEVFHFEEGQQRPGPDPERADFNSFLSFSDPDGTGWMVQEHRPPGAGG